MPASLEPGEKGPDTPESGVPAAAPASEEDARHFVFEIARGMLSDGLQTGETVRVATELGQRLGQEVILMPRWGELIMRTRQPNHRHDLLDIAPCSPHAVAMHRVAAYMHLARTTRLDNLAAGLSRLGTIQRMHATPLLLYMLACIGGALGMAFIFGAQRPGAIGLMAVSAGLGALIRRQMAHLGIGIVWQVGVAAWLAGAIGALAVHWDLTSRLHLVALCPAMILVPGPAILNGLMDLSATRASMGIARLAYASTLLAAICTGLLLGLSLNHVALPLLPGARIVPLWKDVLSAGLAACSFGLLFSMPLRALVWPVCVGMAAHALNWLCKTEFGLSPGEAAGLAAVAAGLVLAPVAHRLDLPFAGIGFAAVVSMIPGSYVFRMASGLLQLQQPDVDALPTLVATLSHGVTAVQIALALSLGLIIPKRMHDEWVGRRERLKRMGA